MRKTGFTTWECLRLADKAERQLQTMTLTNSSDDERELTAAAARQWRHRASVAEKNGGRWHDYYETDANDAMARKNNGERLLNEH